MERIEANTEEGRLSRRGPSPLADDTPICSVVIPTYNGRDLLERCLASIERHRPSNAGIAIEIVVADDASTDGTAQWLAQAYPHVRLVQNQSNGGFCAAANAGIAAARGRFIQLLNNDTEVAAGWIEAGIAPFEEPSVGSVAPLGAACDPSPTAPTRPVIRLTWPAGRPSAATASPRSFSPGGLSRKSSAPADQARSIGRTSSSGWAALIHSTAHTTKTSTSPFACAGPDFARISPRSPSSITTYRRPTITAVASLQRRMSRNAELLFWSNMPGRLLALAFVPHVLFVAAKALWRAARLRLRPFLLGKLDALFCWREILARRRDRASRRAHGCFSPPLRPGHRLASRGAQPPPAPARKIVRGRQPTMSSRSTWVPGAKSSCPGRHDSGARGKVIVPRSS